MHTLNELTLKQALACLSESHHFSEVLDRMSELADSYGETNQSSPEWQQIAKNLETLALQVKRIESRSNSL